LKPKIQWEQLGLSDPALIEPTAIETIRKAVSSLASQGFGDGTKLRSAKQDTKGRGRNRQSGGKRVRRRSATEKQLNEKSKSAASTVEFSLAKEDAIARGSSTRAKRDREKALQRQRQEKEAKRVLRKAEKNSRGPVPEGEDPDLVGLRWGPQPPL